MKPMDQEDILTINNNNNILNNNNKSNSNYYNPRSVMETATDRQSHGRPMPRVRRCSYSQIDFVDHYEKSPNNKNRGLIVHETFFKLKEMTNDLDRHLFLDDYISFMINSGDTEITQKIPIVGKRLLDLVDLYHLVQKHGGFEKVCQKRQLSAVVRELNLPKTITSAANTLRNQFARFLYRFECYQRGVRVNEQFLREQLDSPKPMKESPLSLIRPPQQLSRIPPHQLQPPPVKQEIFYMDEKKTRIDDMFRYKEFRESNDYHHHQVQVRESYSPLNRPPPYTGEMTSPARTTVLMRHPTSISPGLKRPRSTEISRRKSYDENIALMQDEVRSRSVDEIYSDENQRKRKRPSFLDHPEHQEHRSHEATEQERREEWSTIAKDVPGSEKVEGSPNRTASPSLQQQQPGDSDRLSPRKSHEQEEAAMAEDNDDKENEDHLLVNGHGDEFDHQEDRNSKVDSTRPWSSPSGIDNSSIRSRSPKDNSSIRSRSPKDNTSVRSRSPKPLPFDQQNQHQPRPSFALNSSSNMANNRSSTTTKYLQADYRRMPSLPASPVTSSSPTTRHSSHYPPMSASSSSSTEKCRCEDCVPKNYYMGNKRNKQSFMPPSSHHLGSLLPDDGGSSSIRQPYGVHQQQRFLGKDFDDVNLLLKEQQRGFDRFQNNNNNKQYNVNNNNDYKTMNGYHSQHQQHNQKLSTNPTEMNLKIKERTENALVISIVVDGIYYSGTLLTSLKR